MELTATDSAPDRYWRWARHSSLGRATPIAKLLLGVTDPLLLAGLLYLGSGIGLAFATAAGGSLGVVRLEAPLRARDLPWLGAIVLFGGILGPALLTSGLTLTPASSGALLLNTALTSRQLLSLARLLRSRYSGSRRWISEQDFADIVSLCQFMPGPN
jgi:drug/metabolite transporter (DMT)-like permease